MKKYANLFIATTDTVVGIGGPISKKTKMEIFKLKKRPKNKNLIIMVANIEQAKKMKCWSDKANIFAKKYWPGPTTLSLSKKTALRMPDNKKLQKLIMEIGPIYMTSANISGESILTFQDAKKQFNNLGNYYNFGKGSGKPSTIIDINTKEKLR